MDNKSRVPVGWVFVLLSCSGSALLIAVGVGVYAGRIEGQAKAADAAIAELKNSEADRDGLLRLIDERLSRIEGAVGAPRGKSLIREK